MTDMADYRFGERSHLGLSWGMGSALVYAQRHLYAFSRPALKHYGSFGTRVSA